jgi:hypothetical protein
LCPLHAAVRCCLPYSWHSPLQLDMLVSALLLLLLLCTAGSATSSSCTTSFQCSLNGECTAGSCVCEKPWTGPSCGELKYKITPASGKNIYNTSDPRNTWNGPIVKDESGEYRYHAYVPLYKPGSLGGPPSILHGVASNITGPWDWATKPEICQNCGENPAFVIYPSSDGKKVFSLWVGGKIWTASSPDGPFTVLQGAR